MQLFYKFFITLFWFSTVIIYPMLISMYVTLPLFIGFSGLMLILGIEEDRPYYTILSLFYMLNLEINLSLPLLLIPISVMVFYAFIKNRLSFLKMCNICIYVVTVAMINLIYFMLLGFYDFFTSHSSINYDSILLFSIIYDIIAVVLI